MQRKEFSHLAARYGLQLLVFAFGLWLFYSPSILPELVSHLRAGGANDFAIWNEWATGSLTVLIALLSLARSPRLACWGGIVIGVWLLVAPKELGYPASAHAANSIVLGIGLVGLGISYLALHRGIGPLLSSFAAFAVQLTKWLSMPPSRDAGSAVVREPAEPLQPPG